MTGTVVAKASVARRIARAAIHLCVWGGLVALPLAAGPDPRTTVWRILPGFAALAVVFYLDYLLLVPWLLVRRRSTWSWFAVNIALFAGLQVFLLGGGAGFRPSPRGPEPMMTESVANGPVERTELPAWEDDDPWEAVSRPRSGAMVFAALPGLLLLAAGAAGAAALRLHATWAEETRRRRGLETEFRRGELDNLRLRSGARFLIEMLDDIHGLARSDAPASLSAVQDLVRMLRYPLCESESDFVPLRAEIDFLRSYVASRRANLPPNTTVEFRVRDGLDDLPVAPLLFLPLVENAFKHGIHPTRPGAIVIEVARDAGRLRLMVSNPNHACSDPDRTKRGIGIASLRKRLGLLYDGTHRLYTASTPDIHIVSLSILVSAERT